MFSELTRDRFRRFRGIRRAWWSLLILSIAFVLSLFSEFLANDKPLILRHQGKTYFPVVRFYPESNFGLPNATEADYLALNKDASFKSSGGWMLFPPVHWGPYRAHLDLEGNPPHPPSRQHWLGTDNTARDVLSRLLYGFRLCMVFALVIAILAAALGILIGGLQGYVGGWTDMLGQRFIEIWSALPFLYVVILLGAIYGRGFALLVFVVAIFEWIGLSYYLRAEFYRLKNLNYVRAARALGIPEWRIFLRHVLPNALTPVVTILPFTLIAGISTLTSLDFLGFGLQPPAPSWGELLRQGLDNLHAPWLAVTSTTALFITLMLATFVGEGVREAFDPKADARVE
ncbi:MAG TPA: ABC transporter permease [Fibrobacteres bacterium]|nr:ABC transporter permease [Fibrobacterota bacterium]